MFRNVPAAEITETADDAVASADLIPLSVLALDFGGVPAEGWPAFLGRRAIAFVPDDIGRDSIRRSDAQMLLHEQRASQLRAAKLRQLAEAEAVEADQLRRAQIWQGVPADHMPPGVPPAAAMLQTARDAQPKRTTPLEEALSNSGTLTYHPMQGEEAS
jgi:hypothetical protein